MFNNNTFQTFLVNFSSKDKGNFSDGFDPTVQFLNFLAELEVKFVFEAAVHNIGDELKFYFAVPAKISEKIIVKAKKIWEGAEIRPSYGYEIFSPSGVTKGCYLRQKLPAVFSIDFQLKNSASVFSSFLKGFSNVNEVGEGAVIQIIARPAPSSFKKNISKILKKISKGLDWRVALKSYLEEGVSREDYLKNLKAKNAQPLFSVNAVLVASAPSQFQTDEIINGFVDGLGEIRKSFFGLRVEKSSNMKGLIDSFFSKDIDDSQEMLLTSQELATIFHFPAN